MTSLAAVPFPRPHECLECFLLRTPQPDGCDGSLTLTHDWLAWQDCDETAVIDFLQESGGFCDCEVLLNVLGHADQVLVRGAVLSCGEALAP